MIPVRQRPLSIHSAPPKLIRTLSVFNVPLTSILQCNINLSIFVVVDLAPDPITRAGFSGLRHKHLSVSDA